MHKNKIIEYFEDLGTTDNIPLPVSRCSEYISEDTLRCYTNSNPKYYKDKDGNLHGIDLSGIDSSSKIGQIKLHNKGVISVGIRKNGVDKYLGIRPDETQELGTEQIELTPTLINIDGNSKNLDINDLEVKVDKTTVRQLVKVSKEPTDFKISYIFHINGFDLLNSKQIENPVIREAIDIGIVNLGVTNGLDFAELITDDINKPTIFIGFVNDNHMFISGERRKNEFTNLPIDFTFSQTEFPGSSMFGKDNFVVVAKGLDKYNKDLVQKMLVDIFRNKFGLDQHSDNYLCERGKGKSIGWAWDIPGKYFWLMMNTTDISFVGEYFTNKEFNDVSYIPIDYYEFSEYFTNQITNKNINGIQEFGTYIEPEFGVFRFISKYSKQTYTISTPAVLDKDYKVLFNDNNHSLKLNVDGTYTYTKYASVNQIINGFYGVRYIDTTCYSSTNDGQVSNSGSAVWSTVHDATTGNVVNDTSTITGVGVSYVSKTKQWGIQRSFFYFDTSALSGTVTAATLYLYIQGFGGTPGLCAQQGTQGATLATSDYDSFSGTPYFSTASNPTVPSYNAYAWTSGLADIVVGGETKVCVREYNHDYTNTEPNPVGSHASTIATTEDTSGTKDPYLDVTTGGGGGSESSVSSGSSLGESSSSSSTQSSSNSSESSESSSTYSPCIARYGNNYPLPLPEIESYFCESSESSEDYSESSLSSLSSLSSEEYSESSSSSFSSEDYSESSESSLIYSSSSISSEDYSESSESSMIYSSSSLSSEEYSESSSSSYGTSSSESSSSSYGTSSSLSSESSQDYSQSSQTGGADYVVSGSASPNYSGDYNNAGTYQGRPYYYSSGVGAYIWWNYGDWILSASLGDGGSEYFNSPPNVITGTYNPNGEASGYPEVTAG